MVHGKSFGGRPAPTIGIDKLIEALYLAFVVMQQYRAVSSLLIKERASAKSTYGLLQPLDLASVACV